MVIKYQVTKIKDNGQKIIVKTFDVLEDAIKYHRSIKDGICHYHEILVVYDETNSVKMDAKKIFTEIYLKAAKGDQLALKAWPDEILWIDNNCHLIAGDYFMGQTDIISCLEWCEVIER